jgi:hypothetical protein
MAALMIAALTPGFAQAADVKGEHRLSEAEIQKVLDEAAAKRHAQDAGYTQYSDQIAPSTNVDRPVRPIRGEMGFAVGTGGYRSAFGTAVVPIGSQGTAAISFETGRGRGYYGPHPYGYGPYPYR